MPDHQPYQAIILAAGQSTRMGTPKLSLAFRQGVIFLEQCVTQFQLFGCSKVVVVVNGEGLQWIDEHKPTIKKKMRLVLNSDPERGRLSSLQLGIQKSNIKEGLFIHNVDNPFVNQKMLHHMYRVSYENKEFDYISLRYNGQGGHPIMVSKSLAQAILKEPSYESLKHTLSAYKRTDVAVDDPAILVNINTMEEYQQAGLPLSEKTCPVCRRSDEVVPVIYGMPSHELFLEAEQGLVRLGGCCVTEENPQWYCKRDDREF